MSLLLIYLRDRLHWVLLAYANTILVIFLGALLLQVRGIEPGFFQREAGYLLLLTSFGLALALAYDLIRWWPLATQQTRLLQEADQTDALVNLPDAGTADQRTGVEVLRKQHRLFAVERTRYQQAHERQLSFLQLWVHQMKTPISVIGLIAQREGEGGSQQIQKAMTGIEEQVGKVSEGLDLVLHMARLQDFATDYRVEPVDLAQLIRGVINERKKQFIRLGVFPRLEIQAENCTVLSDSKWVGFALDQVVSNALKYGAQTASKDQALTITLQSQGKVVELLIADQGPGIPQQDLPRVFEPFFTGENGRRYAGATGVGLYLVKRVMVELGHTVTIESTPNEQTTVRFGFVTEM